MIKWLKQLWYWTFTHKQPEHNHGNDPFCCKSNQQILEELTVLFPPDWKNK